MTAASQTVEVAAAAAHGADRAPHRGLAAYGLLGAPLAMMAEPAAAPAESAGEFNVSVTQAQPKSLRCSREGFEMGSRHQATLL